MSKESLQWLVLVLVIICLAGLGAMTFNQSSQLSQVSRSLQMPHMTSIQKKKISNEKSLSKAVSRSSKIEGLSLVKATKNLSIIQKLKLHGRAFSV